MNIQKLKGHIPESKLAELPAVIEKFKINTPLRLAHFLSQVYHESNHFTAKTENLNYSEEGLLKIFPRYFTPVKAKEYARKPEKIANLVYANRMGNGPESSGDGWKHRGVGDMQLTGKNNQQAFFKAIGLDPNSDPMLIANKYPLLSAAWFWSTNGLNELADHGSVQDLTKRVNGGLNGISERIKFFNKFYEILK